MPCWLVLRLRWVPIFIADFSQQQTGHSEYADGVASGINSVLDLVAARVTKGQGEANGKLAPTVLFACLATFAQNEAAGPCRRRDGCLEEIHAPGHGGRDRGPLSKLGLDEDGALSRHLLPVTSLDQATDVIPQLP